MLSGSLLIGCNEIQRRPFKNNISVLPPLVATSASWFDNVMINPHPVLWGLCGPRKDWNRHPMLMKNIDIYARPIKKILTILSFRGLKRPHSCEIGLKQISKNGELYQVWAIKILDYIL